MTSLDPRSDRIRDKCGVFGIINHPEAANMTYLGLHGLQHRGQESAGIVTAHEGRLIAYRRLGLVGEIFTPEVLARLSGRNAIGHVRYSTAGESTLSNAQPLTVHYGKGSLAVAHNGHLTKTGSRAARSDLSVDIRHGGAHPPHRPIRKQRCGCRMRGALSRTRILLHLVPVRGQHHRCPGRLWNKAALHRQARW